MEIMEIIDVMEDAVEKAPSVPLSGKIVVDKDEFLDYIQEMRLVYPDEVKEAKWLQGERERMLSEAQSRADALIKSAEEKVVQMIDEHEITKQAVDQANHMVNEAQTSAMEIKADCEQYAKDILSDLEKRMDMLLKKVHDDKAYFEKK